MQLSLCGPRHSPHSLVLQTVCTTPDRLRNRLLYWDDTHTHTFSIHIYTFTHTPPQRWPWAEMTGTADCKINKATQFGCYHALMLWLKIYLSCSDLWHPWKLKHFPQNYKQHFATLWYILGRIKKKKCHFNLTWLTSQFPRYCSSLSSHFLKYFSFI